MRGGEYAFARSSLSPRLAYAFPRRLRLRRAAEYRRVFEQPIRSSDETLNVLARPNTLSHPRLGLAISRKCAKSAVARNRIKRSVRESFRLHQADLPSLDIVVLCRPGVQTLTEPELTRALEGHWRGLSAQFKGR